MNIGLQIESKLRIWSTDRARDSLNILNIPSGQQLRNSGHQRLNEEAQIGSTLLGKRIKNENSNKHMTN